MNYKAGYTDNASFLYSKTQEDKGKKQWKTPLIDKVEIRANMYPREGLSSEQAEAVVRDFRQGLQQRNISFVDCFKLLDENEDGFITISEFMKNLDQVASFSSYVKEGFFAYLDQQHIGMIDYPTFLSFMTRDEFKVQEKQEDTWTWQLSAIAQMQNWFLSESFFLLELNKNDFGKNWPSRMSFRAVDQDFDGFISQSDLKQFLLNVLKLNPNSVTD